jgi:hypothetical protein
MVNYLINVTVEGDSDTWSKERYSRDQSKGTSKMNVAYLKKVVFAIEDALAQAKSDLSGAIHISGDIKNMNRREFNHYKSVWIEANKDLIKSIVDNDYGRTDPKGKELITKARKELGYCDGYVDQDLFRSLVNTYKRHHP